MATKVAPKWHDLGIELDFEAAELDAIRETDHANNRCKEMLSKWLQTKSPSWEKLYNAMCIVQRNAPAEVMKKEVKELYKNKSS